MRLSANRAVGTSAVRARSSMTGSRPKRSGWSACTYSGRSAGEIVATTPDYIARIGLAKHLSPTRSNGLAALLQFIQDTARDALATAGVN